jgi:hypothetical protein
MLVCGGQKENGNLVNEMISLNMDTFEWLAINIKQENITEFTQAGCCAVSLTPAKRAELTQRGGANEAREPPLEGVFYFGGKSSTGECLNKLRFFKPVLVDNKIAHGDFTPIKIIGNPPTARFGHTMSYLPAANAILITGGKQFYFMSVRPK